MPLGKIEAKPHDLVVGVDKVVMRRPSTDNSNKPGTVNGLTVRNSIRDSMHGFPIPTRNSAYTLFGSTESLNDLDTTQFEVSDSNSDNEASVAPALKKSVKFNDQVTVHEYEVPKLTAADKAALWTTPAEKDAATDEVAIEEALAKLGPVDYNPVSFL